MRVTHISVIHSPLDTRIFRKQCRALAADGYDVHLVVANPPCERLDGVHLHSIASVAERPPLRRQLSRQLRAAWSAISLWPSVYHLHDPHLIPLGVMLKLFGARVVYDVHEDYPGHARGKLVHRPLRGRVKALLWRGLEWIARRTLDRFVCASPTLLPRFPATRTTVVHNFPLHREFALNGSGPATPYRERPNTLAYIGTFRAINSFWEIAEAVRLLPRDLDCQVHLIGRFDPPALIERARLHPSWGRFEYMSWRHSPEAHRALARARIGLVMFHPLPNHFDPLRSNKLYEYMAAGLPVIAPDFPMWRKIVRGADCGLVVDPLDPAAIARAIEHLLTQPEEAERMGESGRAAVEAEFNWDLDAPALLEMYRGLENGHPRSPVRASA